MNKQEINIFGDTYFLIGIREDGERVYMQDFSWDCGWYWAGGYLTVFEKRDIKEHYHLDSLMKDTNLYDGIKKHFIETVFSDQQLWEFCELMASFYTLKESAECIGRGGSHYSTSLLTPNKDMAEYVNNTLIKEQLIPKVVSILTTKE